jgi:hypothetical protein
VAATPTDQPTALRENKNRRNNHQKREQHPDSRHHMPLPPVLSIVAHPCPIRVLQIVLHKPQLNIAPYEAVVKQPVELGPLYPKAYRSESSLPLWMAFARIHPDNTNFAQLL